MAPFFCPFQCSPKQSDWFKCMHDVGIHVTSNKNAVLEKLRTNGVTLATGEPVCSSFTLATIFSNILITSQIDDTTYKAMIAAVAPCRGGSCNPTLISKTFTEYLNKAYEFMASPLEDLLIRWGNRLIKIKQSADELNANCDELLGGYGIAKTLIEEQQRALCDDLGWCGVEGVIKSLEKGKKNDHCE